MAGYLAGILLKTAKIKMKATILSFVFIKDLYLCEVFVIEHGQLGILGKHREVFFWTLQIEGP